MTYLKHKSSEWWQEGLLFDVKISEAVLSAIDKNIVEDDYTLISIQQISEQSKIPPNTVKTILFFLLSTSPFRDSGPRIKTKFLPVHKVCNLPAGARKKSVFDIYARFRDRSSDVYCPKCSSCDGLISNFEEEIEIRMIFFGLKRS